MESHGSELGNPPWMRDMMASGSIGYGQCSGPLPGKDVTVVQTGKKTLFILPGSAPNPVSSASAPPKLPTSENVASGLNARIGRRFRCVPVTTVGTDGRIRTTVWGVHFGRTTG